MQVLQSGLQVLLVVEEATLTYSLALGDCKL
jgi:hypothetical protein